jgi:hypothetical protein
MHGLNHGKSTTSLTDMGRLVDDGGLTVWATYCLNEW